MGDFSKGVQFFKETVSIGDWLWGLVIILFLIVSIVALIQKIVDIIKKPVEKAKQDEKDHEVILVAKKDIQSLKKKQQDDVDRSKKERQQIRQDLLQLKNIVLDSEIERMRTSIINFSASIDETTRKDEFDYYFKMYERYENILRKRGQTNGEVTAAVQVIKKRFSERLENGFD